MRATTIEGQYAFAPSLCALRKFHVTDSQNTRDQIASDRMSKCAWSNCLLCIPFRLALGNIGWSQIVTGLPASPVINSVFGRLCRKTASRGREDTRVWYRETMFSQMLSYDFLLHGLLHEYFLNLVSAPPETQKALRTWRRLFALFEAIRS